MCVCAEQSLNTLPLQVKGAPTGLTGLQVHKKKIRKKNQSIFRFYYFRGKTTLINRIQMGGDNVKQSGESN